MQKLRCYTSIMTIDLAFPKHLSDADLLAQVRSAVDHERRATADLIALLAEVDARRLYLAEGCSSLFTFCTQVLHLSEHAAYGRIEAARAARKFPSILDRLRDGTLSLTAVSLLAPHLTIENHAQILDEARHRTKRQIEEIVARLTPKADVATTIRKLPARKSAIDETVQRSAVASSAVEVTPACGASHRCQSSVTLNTSPPSRAELKPLAPERFKLQLTISRVTHDKLRRIQDLLRHSVPDGDLVAIVDKALTLLLEHTERKQLATAKRPRTDSGTTSATRHIPASVRRAVWQRDGGRCAFEGSQGRCRETAFLEFHHLVPFAVGGETNIANLQLRCRAHNQYEAREFFGSRLPLVRERIDLYG